MSVRDNAGLIEVERRAFAETNNPMHAWAAYRLARVAGAEIPGWVCAYLDLAAKQLLALAAETNEKSPQKRNPKVEYRPRIAAAMMLKGSHLTGFHGDWITYGMNVRHRMQNGDKEKYAIEDIAKAAGVHPSTVRRGWKTYDRLFPGDRIFPDEAVSKSR